jgi:hypothetical protein
MVHGADDGCTITPSHDLVAHVKSRALVKIKPPNSYKTSLIFCAGNSFIISILFSFLKSLMKHTF